MKKVGIIGCGWLGHKIADQLSGKYEFYTTTSSTDKLDQLTTDGFNPTLVKFSDEIILKNIKPWNVISNLDAIIITVPFHASNRIKNRFENLISFIGDFKGQLFFMSSTGVYPIIEKEFTEADLPVDSVAGERMIREKYPQVNILRLAGLMGDNRLLYKYKVSQLNHAVNHVHFKDIISIIEKMIEKQFHSKLYNVVATLHPPKSEVIHAAQNIDFTESQPIQVKIISGAKLMNELDYTFQYPDPRYFHL